MYVTYDKSENSRVLSDCAWIDMELNKDFYEDACCEDSANIVHIAELSGRNQRPVNHYSVEIVRDFGFGREYRYRVYKVGDYCEWKDIREEFFTELLQHIHKG